jgi:hypothetical protein
MINFASSFMIGKAHGWWGGGHPKMWGRTWLSPCPRPLILRMPPP